MTEQIAGVSVSRETFARLETYAELLAKWNPRINLVSPATLAEAWTRHFVDSAQLYTLATGTEQHWVDLGSGGGFPGMVIAILCNEQSLTKTTLIESDTRKATFLRTVARETGIATTVLSQRIEAAPPQLADVVSARALAPLPKLLPYVQRHMAPGGRALLPKGISWEKEVENARKTWTFSCQVHKSETDPDAVVLELGELSNV